MKNMSKGLFMAALICGTMNMTAYAQNTAPQEFVLDEYVVTAARTETKLVDTPQMLLLLMQAESKKVAIVTFLKY